MLSIIHLSNFTQPVFLVQQSEECLRVWTKLDSTLLLEELRVWGGKEKKRKHRHTRLWNTHGPSAGSRRVSRGTAVCAVVSETGLSGQPREAFKCRSRLGMGVAPSAWSIEGSADNYNFRLDSVTNLNLTPLCQCLSKT